MVCGFGLFNRGGWSHSHWSCYDLTRGGVGVCRSPRTAAPVSVLLLLVVAALLLLLLLVVVGFQQGSPPECTFCTLCQMCPHSLIEGAKGYKIFACDPLKSSKTLEKEQKQKKSRKHANNKNISTIQAIPTKLKQFSENLGGGTLLSEESGVFVFLVVSIFWCFC